MASARLLRTISKFSGLFLLGIVTSTVADRAQLVGASGSR
jgi:hypothetical protein